MLVVNLIHELPHKQDSAAVLGVDIFGRKWIGNCARVKTHTFIPYDERHAEITPAIAPNVNFFAGILAIAMHDRVRESLTKRELDSKLAAWIAVVFLDFQH